MAMYVVQHGTALYKELDPEQGLSEEGKDKVALIANVAKGYGIQVSDILHSGKKRAVQTAEILASTLDIKGKLIEKSGLAPMDDVVAFARSMVVKKDMMIVGHLPFLEKWVSYLITGSDNHIVFKLQNGGIVCLDQFAPETPWYIKWALMPNIS